MVVKDKVISGVSGGEFGVQGYVVAYNLKDGSEAWRAYSMGPDDQTLIDPEKTTHLGKPVGPDSGTNTWEGDQWKIGGGATWGWYSYDPKLDLFYYGSGNPSTWNPNQRPGDNRWSMTIFARDPDDGMAKWVYQMTPHDEWDFDGINEMILADLDIGGATVPTLVHFDRNGLAYTLNRDTGELLVAEKYDPVVNWTSGVDMDQASATYGRPKVLDAVLDGSAGRGRERAGHLPGGARHQGPAAGGVFAGDEAVLRADQPRLHGLRAVQGELHRRSGLCRRDARHVSGSRTATAAWATSSPGTPSAGKIVWSIPEQFSAWGGALATAGDVVFYGTLEGYLKAVDAQTGEELYKFKTPSGIIGNVMTYEHGGKQYIAVLSGVGGWAGIGLAAGLLDPESGGRLARRGACGP